MTRETVGKVATGLLQKSSDPVSVIDQTQESLTDYEKNLTECLEKAKKELTGDFYIVVLTKREQLLQNVIRNYFFPRLSCPTPDWDQAVYKYKRLDDNLVFMWVIPAREFCEYIGQYAHLIDRNEHDLVKFVLAFNDGTLMRLAKELNGEKSDTPELEGFIYKG